MKILTNEDFNKNSSVYYKEILSIATLRDRDNFCIFDANCLKCFYKIDEHLFYDVCKCVDGEKNVVTNADLVALVNGLRLVVIDSISMKEDRKNYTKTKEELYTDYLEQFVFCLSDAYKTGCFEWFPVITKEGTLKLRKYDATLDSYVEVEMTRGGDNEESSTGK